jgi:hypothetical protein
MILKKLLLFVLVLITFNGIGQEIQGWSYKIITAPKLEQYGSLEIYLIDSSLLQLTKNKLNKVESVVIETKNYEVGYNAIFKNFESEKISNYLDFQIDTLVNKLDSFLVLIRSNDTTSFNRKIVPFKVLFDQQSKPSNLKLLNARLALFSSQFPLKFEIGYPKPLVVFERVDKCYLPEIYHKKIVKIKKRHSKLKLKKLIKKLNYSQNT